MTVSESVTVNIFSTPALTWHKSCNQVWLSAEKFKLCTAVLQSMFEGSHTLCTVRADEPSCLNEND